MESQVRGSSPSSRDWVWYGGRPSIDFVNTLRDRFRGGRDLLLAPDDLTAWFTAARQQAAAPTGEPSAERLAVDDELLAQAVRLREAVDAGVRAVVAGTPFPEEAAEVINSWLARAAEHPLRLAVHDGRPTLQHTHRPADATTALVRIAVDAAEILGGEDRRRLKICTGNGCSARYYDKSPGGRRRWCSMSGCGNRAKAAQHRQRTAAE
ncbi:ABATE domain-containing protein [Kitasatospora sp. NPDC096077]|uniref:CGNR zinc finger domain-containing protein n=1 Tax=Kitasatospora sp. NPDC096077 TaxID=3155544 RepID=UPI003330D8A4